MANPLTMNVLTTEYVHVDVTATGPLTSYPVEFAWIDKGAEPVDGDWMPGSWTPGETAQARLLVGPLDGALVLEKGKQYDVWLRIMDNPEMPVRYAGRVKAV